MTREGHSPGQGPRGQAGPGSCQVRCSPATGTRAHGQAGRETLRPFAGNSEAGKATIPRTLPLARSQWEDLTIINEYREERPGVNASPV